MRRLSIFTIFAAALATFAGNAQAVSLRDSMFVREGFTFGSSFDPAPAGVIQTILASGLTDGNVYGYGTFSGGNEAWQFVAEITSYDSQNSLGFIDAGNNYTAFVQGTDVPGATGVVNFPGTDIELASASPGSSNGYWYSTDSRNPDKAPHIIGLRITQDGVINFAGFTPSVILSLVVKAGDIIVGVEDLNSEDWDYDYNDLVTVMREVPEPSTVILFGSALLAGLARRRRVA